MAFYEDPGLLWIVRTKNGWHNHIAESNKAGTRPIMRRLCGCSVRSATEYRRVTDISEISCKRCQVAQRQHLMNAHGKSGAWMHGVYNQKCRPLAFVYPISPPTQD